MTNTTITAENLGPISALEFALESPGVTVLVAPNGSGKTILLEAVQAAAVGKGKLPLKDRSKRGKVEAFGAHITIGGTCRHTGAFEVTNLEGRFDLAGLVDPQIKAPALADKARIKALVSLTGVAASVDLFRNHEAFESFGKVVKATSVETDDLIEMATKIKDDYDGAARGQEDAAERETGHATALIPPKDLDLQDESDSKILQAAYDEARDVCTRLHQQTEQSKHQAEITDRATKLLEELGDEELRKQRQKLSDEAEITQRMIAADTQSISNFENQIVSLRSMIKSNEAGVKHNTGVISTIDRQLILVEEAKLVMNGVAITSPSEAEVNLAIDARQVASDSVERGTLIRQAIKDSEKAAGHRKAASAARGQALKYREAGKATDEVLSSCIKCDQLRVESDGKAARLVTDSTERGKSIPFHDLSDGEKWTIAIDIGADQVGSGGLLVISQVGWEGIDGANRQAIHHHAVQRGVYILTAEASSDPDATREIVPTRLPDVEPPVKPKAKIDSGPTLFDDAPEPKPVAVKPKVKPLPKPVEVEADDDDIPF